MAGFGTDTLDYLADLGRAEDADAFDRLRDRHHAHGLTPARAFVEAVVPALRALEPRLTGTPAVHGSLLHVRRSRARQPDAPLYRDHLGLVFWEGDRATCPSVLFLRLYPDRLVLGAGARRPTREQLAALRSGVLAGASGRALVTAVAGVRAAGFAVHGATLASGPRDVDVGALDDDRASLLRHTALWAEHAFPLPGVLGSASLVPWCVRRWTRLLPLHRWLCDHLPR